MEIKAIYRTGTHSSNTSAYFLRSVRKKNFIIYETIL